MADINDAKQDVQNKNEFVIKFITADKKIVSIPTADILNCYFIEDIFMFSMVGRLEFIDKIGIMEFLPITGEEVVAIIYGDTNKQVLFNVFTMGKIEQASQIDVSVTNVIEIYLVDANFFRMTQRRYSTSWTNTKISDIVKDILNYTIGITEFARYPDGTYNFEETNETLPYFYTPYWTPLESLKWLIERSSGKDTGTAGYCCYPTPYGINYISVDKLFQNTKLEKDDKGTSIAYKLSDPNAIGRSNLFLSWEMSPIDMAAMVGLRGGRRLGYSFIGKSLLKAEHIYKEAIAQYTLLGKRSLFPDISDLTIKNRFEGESDIDLLNNLFFDEFVKRYSKQLAIFALIKGLETRYAGMMIKVEWPSSEKSEIGHRALQGKWLIKSITHQFSGRLQPPYRQRMVLLKNAYDDSYSKTLIMSSKINI